MHQLSFRILLFFLFFSPLIADPCPELEGLSIRDPRFEQIGRISVRLKKVFFYEHPIFAELDYEKCAAATELQGLRDRHTGKTYKAFVTTQDECDGGNTLGLLFDWDLSVKIGEIHDSEIYCINSAE